MTKEVQDIQVMLVPTTVADLAEKLKEPISSVILFLLKQGVVASKNQVLPVDLVAKIARSFEIEPTEMPTISEGSKKKQMADSAKGEEIIERLPVVVVVGHVDHGKTTLLDFIRKTRVASREKGGITQHVGAYKAHTEHGDLVFLDTPGHEAFSIVRSRGIDVADLAILVVAADGGVMPQTIEAIELLREAKIPIVVALNKIDRASQKQIEAVKSALSKHGLISEEWGGDTLFVPISALKGTGVDDLLAMVVLRSQDLDLMTYRDVPATGYILESRMEKGRGAVATVICRQGIVRVGDDFVVGSSFGRISSIKDATGAFIKEAMPSEPITIAGFDGLPGAGDVFRIGTLATLPPEKPELPRVDAAAFATREGSIKLIVKADSVLSLEVLLTSLAKISKKSYTGLQIVSSGVGTVSESDIHLAADTKAILLGLHIKVETKAMRSAQDLGVTVKLFDVIYHMLEWIEEAAEKGRPIKTVLQKVGEATILKVFDIKKLGIIAGARIVDGYCSRQSKVKVFRGNRLVGSGNIISLQRDKNPAKEVKKGFECAFKVDGFTEWQVDDRVECYEEVRVD